MAASAFYFIGEIKNAKLKLNQTGQQLGGQKYDAAGTDNYWLGSAKANITIVEFGDFACPHCEQAFPTARALSINYKNDIKFIWRDYPVVSDYSANLALAGRCAGEQGLFWLMHDKLFQNQGITMISEAEVLATQIGVDIKRYKDCIQSKKYSAEILKDYAQGQKLGITGTPTWFFNGYKIEGDIPSDIFVKLVEEGLK